MNRRSVITGIGAVSPNGIGREQFWEATRNGLSGVTRISRFDSSPYAVQIAGEVRGFDEDRYVAPKDRPHVSRVVPLSIAATEEALHDPDIYARDPDRFAELTAKLASLRIAKDSAEERWLQVAAMAEALQQSQA